MNGINVRLIADSNEDDLIHYDGDTLSNDSDLLEFALDKLLYMTKEELIERYKENKIDKQDLEDMIKRCNDFENYCSSRCCDDCDINKFQKRNGLNRLGTRNCMLIYEYLFKK